MQRKRKQTNKNTERTEKKGIGGVHPKPATQPFRLFLIGLEELLKVLRFLAHTQSKHSLLQISQYRWKGYKPNI